ncbi:unnamed protein product [Rotaria sp. Silwood2]|nr:unnamed protein product [Rotaria sp. Silwood2]
MQTTTTYLHRVDSSSSARRMIIVRQNKEKPTTSPNTLNIEKKNLQQLSIIDTSVLTIKKNLGNHYSSRFESMRRRKIKDSSSIGDQRICTKENCLSCCKKFTAFMFSRVGLFFVMIGYVALGGWLFQALEAHNEQDMRRSMSEKLNLTLDKLWEEILRVNSYPYHDKKGNFTLNATEELEKFEATVIQQVQQGFDGRTKPGADPDWNFFGAILYAVTLVSTIGYGHITTKTIPGKVATVLYSAFGVPLMMLFVANIGSTMAKLFAFVFSRLYMIFCCRWKNKKKRRNLKKSQQKNNQISIIVDEQKSITKSNLKYTKDDQEVVEKILIDNNNDQSSNVHLQTQINSSSQYKKISTTDTKQLPADIRLDMLTGVAINKTKSRSSTSPTNTVGERSKDALVRINELIRQNSVQDVEKQVNDEIFNDNDVLLTLTKHDERRSSNDISPIQFYINETNKLTSNLESSLHDKTIIKSEQEKQNITNLDDTTIQQTKKKEFLLCLARATNGRFVFIPPKSNVDVYVGEQLQKALQSCITYIKVKWNFGTEVMSAPTKMPPVYVNDRLIAYALVNDTMLVFNHNSSVELNTDRSQIGQAKIDSIPKVVINGTIARLAAKALILELQHSKLKQTNVGSLQPRFQQDPPSTTPIMMTEEKEMTKKRIIDLSLKYQILSLHTAVIGVEK